MAGERAAIKVAIESWWHAGSGRGGGDDFDAQVVRDGHGFPYLPGRHLKGLLRHAALCLTEWAGESDDCWKDGQFFVSAFGKEAGVPGADLNGDKNNAFPARVERGRTRHETVPGSLTVSDARLPQGVRTALANDDRAMRELFSRISATAIDPESRTAKRKALRTVEVVLPVTLVAELEWDAADRSHLLPRADRQDDFEEMWMECIEDCLPLIRAVGAHRTRGLGRARLTLTRPALNDDEACHS